MKYKFMCAGHEHYFDISTLICCAGVRTQIATYMNFIRAAYCTSVRGPGTS